ncbi:MAG: TonB-dependent receptor [bacterium]
MKRTLFALFACAISLSVFAADSTPDVVMAVTGERQPVPVSESIASVSIITAADIAKTGASNVSELMQLMPGVQINPNGTMGSLSSPIIRGSSGSHVLILIDGKRISTPASYSGADLAKFPVDQIDRVEIIRGPVSALYGSDSIGGVINIITKKNTGSGGALNLSMGNNAHMERSVSAYGDLYGNQWSASGSFPSYNGSRPNSKFRAVDYNIGYTMPKVGNWKLNAGLNHYADKLGLPGPDNFANTTDSQWWTRDSIDLGGETKAWKGIVNVRLYHNMQDLTNAYYDSFAAAMASSLITGSTDVIESTYSRNMKAHEVVGGIEIRSEKYKSISSSSPTQKESLDNQAVYVQDRWTIDEDTDVVGALRYDNHSTAGGKLTPRAGLNTKIADNARMRVSFSEGFTAPNFVQLFYDNPWGAGYDGNPNLKPETSRQVEIGMNYEMGIHTFDFAYFRTKITDLIESDGVTPYKNTNSATRKGIEMTWNARVDKVTNIGATFSLTDAYNDKTLVHSLRLPSTKITAQASRSFKNWDAGIDGIWVSKADDKFFNPSTYATTAVVLPAHAIFNLSLTRTGLKNLTPYFIVRNLTGTNYQSIAGYKAEDRNFEAGVRYKW